MKRPKIRRNAHSAAILNRGAEHSAEYIKALIADPIRCFYERMEKVSALKRKKSVGGYWNYSRKLKPLPKKERWDDDDIIGGQVRSDMIAERDPEHTLDNVFDDNLAVPAAGLSAHAVKRKIAELKAQPQIHLTSEQTADLLNGKTLKLFDIIGGESNG